MGVFPLSPGINKLSTGLLTGVQSLTSFDTLCSSFFCAACLWSVQAVPGGLIELFASLT